MRPRFLERPNAYLRASRTLQSQADYSSPVTRFDRAPRGGWLTLATLLIAFAGLGILLAWRV